MMKIFFETLRKYWQIIKINTINTWMEETAYFFNNWGNVLSTISYTLAQILFIKIIFNKFHTIAGYNYNEIMFLTLISQFTFYILYGIFKRNIEALIDDVKKGNLDFTLIRPTPSLFFVSFKKIPLCSTLRDGIANFIILLLLINWSALSLAPLNVFMGVLTMICGIIIWHCVMFIATFAIFWLGEAKKVFFFIWSFSDYDELPYEGFPKFAKIFLSYIMPAFWVNVIPISIMLNKSSTQLFIPSFILAIIFLFIKKWAWNKGLKAYTSAS